MQNFIRIVLVAAVLLGVGAAPAYAQRVPEDRSRVLADGTGAVNDSTHPIFVAMAAAAAGAIGAIGAAIPTFAMLAGVSTPAGLLATLIATTADYDTAGPVVNLSMLGLALPSALGPVAAVGGSGNVSSGTLQNTPASRPDRACVAADIVAGVDLVIAARPGRKMLSIANKDMDGPVTVGDATQATVGDQLVQAQGAYVPGGYWYEEHASGVVHVAADIPGTTITVHVCEGY